MGATLFSSGPAKNGIFSEALLCLMGLEENPLSKEDTHGGKYTGRESRVQQEN
jgi:hypothetical protein